VLTVAETITQVDVKADTAQEFMTGGNKKFGSNNLGVTTYHLDPTYTYNKDKTIASATICMKLKTTMPKWVKGSKTPDKANMEALNQIVALIGKHEQKHRDTYKQAFNKSDVDKTVIGKTDGQADKILDALAGDLDKVCEDLHSKEGKIHVVQTGGTFKVTMVPAGSGGCKP
jgi:predicted secreted Zn-dependent protease